MSKLGANGFLTYSPSTNAKVDISLGGQSSEAQKMLLGATGSGASGTYFTTNETKTGYVHVKSDIYGVRVRASYLQGTDGLIVGASPSQYDYQISDVVAEYAFSFGKASITPGVSYLSAMCSDTNYLEDQQGVGFFAQNRTITNVAPFVRTDIKATDRLRMAALRADKIQQKPFITVQQTNAIDVPLAYITPAVAASLGSPHSTVDTQSGQHTHTPSIVGGFFANYMANARLNINING